MATPLQGLDKYCSELNLSGLLTIEYAPLRHLDLSAWSPIRTINNNHQFSVIFETGTWLKAKVLPNKKLWSENQRVDKQGTSYDQQVRAILPGLKPAGNGELERMSQHRFILRVKDKSGQFWILGSPQYPFFFRTTGTTGENGGLNHHTLIWTSSNPRKAAGYVPVF